MSSNNYQRSMAQILLVLWWLKNQKILSMKKLTNSLIKLKRFSRDFKQRLIILWMIKIMLSKRFSMI
jgi:hypothetical protein